MCTVLQPTHSSCPNRVMERKLSKLWFYIGPVVYVSGGNGGVMG